MEYIEHKIDSVEPGSIAEKCGISSGDFLLSVNESPISDVFDYHYLINDDVITLKIKTESGCIRDIRMEKPYYEDPGIIFENGLMDEYRSCRNKCIFCFIDQMPPNMRETLYFKDDDSRLSFLQGNYVTLTNMSEQDIERIITYKMAPINISVHTTNPSLRCRMLNNRFAGEALEKIKRLYEAGIEMNAQIVLCKGINDGEELERSIRDLAEYIPFMESLSVVPVGLTKYRKNLYPLEPFKKEDAAEVLATIHKWQKICYEKHGVHFVQAGDEWYLLAQEPFPPEENYDGYIQLENGVGMMRLLEEEFLECLREDKLGRRRFGGGLFGKKHKRQRERTISIATGKLATGLISTLAAEFMALYPQIKINVYTIENNFFGEMITVSGLITGGDLIEQLRGRDLGEYLLLPCSMMRSGEEVFLDDVTLGSLEKTLQVNVHIVKSDGKSLYDSLLGIFDE